MAKEKWQTYILGFYKKSNSNFKRTTLFLILLVILIGFNLFNISFGSSTFWTVMLAYALVFVLIFPESSPDFGKTILTLILCFMLIVLIFAWLNGGNIPYTNLKADSDAIMKIFTIVLAIATIINIGLYRQTIGFSRLSEVDFYLNTILAVEIENKGNYPVRNIKLKTKVVDKQRNNGWLKSKIKDSFLSPEYEKHYLSSKGRYAEKLKDYLEERFNLEFNSDIQQYVSARKKFFKIRLELNYQSDALFQNPVPIIKEYEIEVDSEGTTRKEVKPSPE